MKSKALILFTLFFLSNLGWAKTFSTDYLTFNLAEDWNCNPNGSSWVCEPNNALAKRLTMITISAKHAGPTDNLEAFQSYLSQPRSHQMGSKTPVLSQVMNNARRQLGNWQWVQSMHLGSEVKDFNTMYLATVKNDLAIMLTISAEKNQWNKFNPVFDKLISSLQLKNFPSPNSASIKAPNSEGHGGMVAQGNAPASNASAALVEDAPPTRSLPTVYWVGLGLAALILAAAAYIFLKAN